MGMQLRAGTAAGVCPLNGGGEGTGQSGDRGWKRAGRANANRTEEKRAHLGRTKGWRKERLAERKAGGQKGWRGRMAERKATRERRVDRKAGRKNKGDPADRPGRELWILVNRAIISDSVCRVSVCAVCQHVSQSACVACQFVLCVSMCRSQRESHVSLC